ncbi:MAG: transcription termination factor NusA [Cytophagales bacterium]|nr:transcription termination factor NusA [Cytophagales bacterium]
MDKEKLIEPFAAFAKSKNIDRPTVIKILEDVFKTMIRKKFGTEDNFDVIINLDKGDLQIWRFREIVDDNAEDRGDHDKISLSEARKIEPDFEIGEEVAEEIKLADFQRRAVMTARQTLIQKVKDLEKDNLYHKYSQLIGEIVNAEVCQVLGKEVILLDDEKNELSLPKSEQIPGDRFKKGEYIRAIVHKVELQNTRAKIILSRTSAIFLEKLFENEVPEVADGLITIKKVVREPGGRAKVAVESYDDRVDPVGACVGMKGTRIHGIVRELQGENIDVINYTDNMDLYIARALSPAKISSIKQMEERIAVYMKPEQVALAIGKGGQNIKLASQLISKEIDIYRELGDQEEDVDLEEFADEIDSWVIDELRRVGLDTAKNVLTTPKEDVERRTDLEKETIDRLYKILDQEFKE